MGTYSRGGLFEGRGLNRGFTVCHVCSLCFVYGAFKFTNNVILQLDYVMICLIKFFKARNVIIRKVSRMLWLKL